MSRDLVLHKSALLWEGSIHHGSMNAGKCAAKTCRLCQSPPTLFDLQSHEIGCANTINRPEWHGLSAAAAAPSTDVPPTFFVRRRRRRMPPSSPLSITISVTRLLSDCYRGRSMVDNAPSLHRVNTCSQTTGLEEADEGRPHAIGRCVTPWHLPLSLSHLVYRRLGETRRRASGGKSFRCSSELPLRVLLCSQQRRAFVRYATFAPLQRLGQLLNQQRNRIRAMRFTFPNIRTFCTLQKYVGRCSVH